MSRHGYAALWVEREAARNMELDFCKMDIGPIFFPEIGFTISGENERNLGSVNELQIGKEKSLRDFSFPK
jgi:hypothetical protein